MWAQMAAWPYALKAGHAGTWHRSDCNGCWSACLSPSHRVLFVQVTRAPSAKARTTGMSVRTGVPIPRLARSKLSRTNRLLAPTLPLVSSIVPFTRLHDLSMALLCRLPKSNSLAQAGWEHVPLKAHGGSQSCFFLQQTLMLWGFSAASGKGNLEEVRTGYVGWRPSPELAALFLVTAGMIQLVCHPEVRLRLSFISRCRASCVALICALLLVAVGHLTSIQQLQLEYVCWSVIGGDISSTSEFWDQKPVAHLHQASRP